MAGASETPLIPASVSKDRMTKLATAQRIESGGLIATSPCAHCVATKSTCYVEPYSKRAKAIGCAHCQKRQLPHCYWQFQAQPDPQTGLVRTFSRAPKAGPGPGPGRPAPAAPGQPIIAPSANVQAPAPAPANPRPTPTPPPPPAPGPATDAAVTNSTSTTMPKDSTSSVAATARKPFPKLVAAYKPPKFANDEIKQIYNDTVREYEKLAHATWEEILANAGNPFDLKSRDIAPLFNDAMKVKMNGVDAPPPFEPLSPAQVQPKGPRLTHGTQKDATFIDAPRAAQETLDLDTNPDALAIRANIGILLYQEKKTLANIKRLDLLSLQVGKHPREFAQAIIAGDIKINEKTDPSVAAWLAPYAKSGRFLPWKKVLDEDQIKEEINRMVDEWEALEKLEKDKAPMTEEQKRRLAAYIKGENPDKVHFAAMPEKVTVSKTPAINWAQYGVVGDSLDAVHTNVLETLGSAKKPADIATDGSIKTKTGNPDPRYMDREAYKALMQEQKAAGKESKARQQ